MLGNNQASAATHPGYVAGNWHAPPLYGTPAAGAALTANVVALVPFYLTKPIKISDLGCRITTLAAGGNVRLGIYRADPTNNSRATGTAVVETGNITTASAGTVSAAVSASATLSPGLYYMAVNSDNATVVLQNIVGASGATSIVGSATLGTLTSAAGVAAIRYTFSSTFGAFPDLTSQALTETATLGWGLVYMKAS